MTKVIKKLFRTYIELDSGKIIKPLDGGWYDGRQYYKGKLGKIGEPIPMYPIKKFSGGISKDDLEGR